MFTIRREEYEEYERKQYTQKSERDIGSADVHSRFPRVFSLQALSLELDWAGKWHSLPPPPTAPESTPKATQLIVARSGWTWLLFGSLQLQLSSEMKVFSSASLVSLRIH